MKKLINFVILIYLGSAFIIRPTILDCIQNSDRMKKACAFECIARYPCFANCDPNYLITDQMERACYNCAQQAKKCIEICDQERSNYQNYCINNFCLDPWCDCPSCGMNF